MSESNMRRKVVKALKSLDAIAVENPVYPGTPDVNHIHGWIELKWLRSWPKRKDTIVKIEHYTLEQKLWIRRRHKNGGQVTLLLQCGNTWLLFDAIMAQQVGSLTREELESLATVKWNNGLVERELIDWIIQNQ